MAETRPATPACVGSSLRIRMDRSDAAPDAVVIGAGHNGLVAANILADAGWDVWSARPPPNRVAPFAPRG